VSDPYTAVGLIPTVRGVRKRAEIQRNLEHISHLIAAATWLSSLDLPVRLVLLPEGALQGFTDEVFDLDHVTYARESAIDVPGPETDYLGQLARHWKIFIMGQAKARHPAFPDRFFNVGFAIDPRTWEAARSNAEGLKHLSAERVRDEWFKGIATAKRVSKLLTLWIDVGAARIWLPEIRKTGNGKGETGNVEDDRATIPVSRFPFPAPDAATLQALLDLSGPGGYVLLLGSAAHHAVGLAALMGGIHFVGVNAPDDVAELPVLSLLACETMIPLRQKVGRAAVVGPDRLSPEWLAEARRVLLPGRRLVIESEHIAPPAGLTQLALGHGLFVGERR